jgi:hypothetical protein
MRTLKIDDLEVGALRVRRLEIPEEKGTTADAR